MNEKLTGRRVAIVTDCEMHLGPDLALELAKRDHNLVLGGASSELLSDLQKIGVQAVNVEDVDDLTQRAAVEKLVEAAVRTFGRLDAACVRTGKIITGDFLEATEKDVDELCSLNIASVLFALQSLVPVMTQQENGGQILIVTSAAGETPTPSAALYSATRAAANMLVKNAALTMADKNVNINSLGTNYLDYPGFRIATGADDPAIRARIESRVPLKRLGQPAEVAHFAAGLLDGKNRFQTGQFFALSGGA